MTDIPTIGAVRARWANHARESDQLTHRLIERLYERVGELEREVRWLREEMEERRG